MHGALLQVVALLLVCGGVLLAFGPGASLICGGLLLFAVGFELEREHVRKSRPPAEGS